VLSTFTATLKDAYAPQEERKPARLSDVVSIFAMMGDPMSKLFDDAKKILHRQLSLREFFEGVESPPTEEKQVEDANKEIEELARSLTENVARLTHVKKLAHDLEKGRP
jgi:hypothetical protein